MSGTSLCINGANVTSLDPLTTLAKVSKPGFSLLVIMSG